MGTDVGGPMRPRFTPESGCAPNEGELTAEITDMISCFKSPPCPLCFSRISNLPRAKNKVLGHEALFSLLLVLGDDCGSDHRSRDYVG